MGATDHRSGGRTRPGPSGDAAPLVAAGHRVVVEAAHEILGAGGNAYDAVVAAGFAASVAEPGLTSLAGGGFCLVRTAAGEEVLFDFFVDTPGRGGPPAAEPRFHEVMVDFGAALQPFHCGPGSIAVPGVLAGYLHLHQRLGRIDLATVVAPAVRLAEQGVELLPRQAGIVSLLEPILLGTDAGRALFAPGGRLLGAGDRFRNPDLAGFVAGVGRGTHRSFADDDLAAALLSITADGGLMTAADLDAYRVVEREPLAVDWRDHRVLTNPAPSFGGRLIAAGLARLDEVGLPPNDPRWPSAVVEAAADVDRRRAAILADDPGRPGSTRGTTHISVWDSEGNAAAMTTSNGECSGDVIPGTGILTNNVLGEDDLHPDGFHVGPSGQRVASMMSPTIAVDAGGRTALVVGSGGSKRIRAAVTQVLLNVLVHGHDPRTAVDAPRVHWDVDHVEAEPGLPAAARTALAEIGPVNEWPDTNVYFGGAHLVVPGVGAAGDPRRDGSP